MKASRLFTALLTAMLAPAFAEAILKMKLQADVLEAETVGCPIMPMSRPFLMPMATALHLGKAKSALLLVELLAPPEATALLAAMNVLTPDFVDLLWAQAVITPLLLTAQQLIMLLLPQTGHPLPDPHLRPLGRLQMKALFLPTPMLPGIP